MTGTPLDQVGIAAAMLVQYSSAEDSQLRDEDLVSQTVGNIIVERYAGYESAMTVLVRLRYPWYETLRVSHGRAENWVSGDDS